MLQILPPRVNGKLHVQAHGSETIEKTFFRALSQVLAEACGVVAEQDWVFQRPSSEQR